MSFLSRLFSVPERDSLKMEPSATRIPDEGFVRVKVPGMMLSAVDSNLGGVLRVKLHNGVPEFFEPISTIDYLSEQDLSFTSSQLARRKLVEV